MHHNYPGEFFVFGWSLYRDVLTLTAVPGETSPPSMVAKVVAPAGHDAAAVGESSQPRMPTSTRGAPKLTSVRTPVRRQHDQLTVTRDNSLGIGPTPFVIRPYLRQP